MVKNTPCKSIVVNRNRNSSHGRQSMTEPHERASKTNRKASLATHKPLTIVKRLVIEGPHLRAARTRKSKHKSWRARWHTRGEKTIWAPSLFVIFRRLGYCEKMHDPWMSRIRPVNDPPGERVDGFMPWSRWQWWRKVALCGVQSSWRWFGVWLSYCYFEQACSQDSGFVGYLIKIRCF